MNNREVMQQALEALELSTPKARNEDDYAEQGWEEHHAAITALKAALAEPTCKEHLHVEPVQEPVAWRYKDTGHFTASQLVSKFPEWQPLYTHPAPQRQPLTEDEAWDMWEAVADRGKKGVHIVIDFARAVEAAHRIGGQDDTR